jgi:ribosomal protein S27AE
MICDVCATNGKSSEMRKYADAQNGLRISMCISAGCERLFDRTNGYYSMHDGHPTEQKMEVCPDCGTIRVLGHYSPRAGQRWLCRCERLPDEDESFQSSAG